MNYLNFTVITLAFDLHDTRWTNAHPASNTSKPTQSEYHRKINKKIHCILDIFATNLATKRIHDTNIYIQRISFPADMLSPRLTSTPQLQWTHHAYLKGNTNKPIPIPHSLKVEDNTLKKMQFKKNETRQTSKTPCQHLILPHQRAERKIEANIVWSWISSLVTRAQRANQQLNSVPVFIP